MKKDFLLLLLLSTILSAQVTHGGKEYILPVSVSDTDNNNNQNPGMFRSALNTITNVAKKIPNPITALKQVFNPYNLAGEAGEKFRTLTTFFKLIKENKLANTLLNKIILLHMLQNEITFHADIKSEPEIALLDIKSKQDSTLIELQRKINNLHHYDHSLSNLLNINLHPSLTYANNPEKFAQEMEKLYENLRKGINLSEGDLKAFITIHPNNFEKYIVDTDNRINEVIKKSIYEPIEKYYLLLKEEIDRLMNSHYEIQKSISAPTLTKYNDTRHLIMFEYENIIKRMQKISEESMIHHTNFLKKIKEITSSGFYQ